MQVTDKKRPLQIVNLPLKIRQIWQFSQTLRGLWRQEFSRPCSLQIYQLNQYFTGARARQMGRFELHCRQIQQENR
jgi:hypothetical protein